MKRRDLLKLLGVLVAVPIALLCRPKSRPNKELVLVLPEERGESAAYIVQNNDNSGIDLTVWPTEDRIRPGEFARYRRVSEDRALRWELGYRGKTAE